MLCYCCKEIGVECPAVALCRSCGAGLCTEHLRETATRLAVGHLFERCHHDTWAVLHGTDAHHASGELA